MAMASAPPETPMPNCLDCNNGWVVVVVVVVVGIQDASSNYLFVASRLLVLGVPMVSLTV